MIVLLLILLSVIIYTFGGYHFLIYLLSKGKNSILSINNATNRSSISIILVMKNEERFVKTRINNLLEQYPNNRSEIIVFLDASTDNTKEILSEIYSPNIKVFYENQPIGKSACIEKAIKIATHDYLVFADARQVFNNGAIKSLISFLQNPEVGAVSGELVIGANKKNRSISHSYWTMEKWLRKSESLHSSVIGCTGAIYAVKKELCPETIPPDTILDDVIIPIYIQINGKRVIFDSNAVAIDSLIPTFSQEFKRKVRTLAGVYQIMFRYPEWLSPRLNKQWWQLISHKYLRLFGPYLLLAQYGVSMYLAKEMLIISLFCILQTVFILLGLIGIVSKRNLKSLEIISSFIILNAASLFSLIYYRSGLYKTGWLK